MPFAGRLHLRSDKTLTDLARMFNTVIRGWINYYGRFYKSRLLYFLRRLNNHLVRWVCRKDSWATPKSATSTWARAVSS